MEKRLKQMKQMPSAFVCANDFIAVNVMKALKNNQIAIPGDIAVCGFDNAPESRIVEPHLSTVHIYSDEMGIRGQHAVVPGERTGVTLSSHPYPNKTDLQGIDRKTD